MHLITKDRHLCAVKDWENVLEANGPRKQAGSAVLIATKIDLNPEPVRDSGGLYSSRRITPNTGARHFTKQALLDIKSLLRLAQYSQTYYFVS